MKEVAHEIFRITCDSPFFLSDGHTSVIAKTITLF